MPRALWLSLAICVAGAAAEGLAAGRGVAEKLARLRQPRWALPLPAWYCVGLLYYAALFLSSFTVLRAGATYPHFDVMLCLIGFIALTQAVWNYVFFRRVDLRTGLLIFVPYVAAVLALLVLLSEISPAAAWGFGVYVAYLPYGLAWSASVYRMNRG